MFASTLKNSHTPFHELTLNIGELQTGRCTQYYLKVRKSIKNLNIHFYGKLLYGDIEFGQTKCHVALYAALMTQENTLQFWVK